MSNEKRVKKNGSKTARPSPKGRWVCYYYSILGGVQYVTYHKDRKEAARHFNRTYKCFFQYTANPFKVTPDKLPCWYGFAHRSYNCSSRVKFEKAHGKYGEGNWELFNPQTGVNQ